MDIADRRAAEQVGKNPMKPRPALSVLSLLGLIFLPPLVRAGESYGKADDNGIYAEKVVKEAKFGNPDLIWVGIHAAAPGTSDYRIAASTLDLIGKKSDDNDIDVITDGKTHLTPNARLGKLGVMLPLHDAAGGIIGALGMAFKYHAGDDEAELFSRATAIRNQLAARIPDQAALFRTEAPNVSPAASPASHETPAAILDQTKGDEKSALILRDIHFKTIGSRMHKRFYDAHWDLGGLPEYRPGPPLTGTIRIRGGTSYVAEGDFAREWEKEFHQYQPGIRIEYARYDLKTGLVDMSFGRRMTWSELQEYQDNYNHYPFEIDYSTGSYNIGGWSPAFAMFVSKDNPLSQVTLKQLDGIFGSRRSGGWVGTVWHSALGRGAEGNIRKWGQLGLTGKYQDADIHVYGRPMRYHIQLYFEQKVFNGGDLWNENLREYAHELGADKTRKTASIEMAEDVGKDPFGIAMSDLGSVNPDVKALAIAPRDSGPYVPLTLETVHDRTYPLSIENYVYAHREPGKPLDPKVREFLAYILSRQGQEAIQRDGKWLPLTAEVSGRELAKLQ